MKKLYTAKEIEEITGIKRKSLYRMASEKRVPHYRIGGDVRFDLNDFRVETKGEDDGIFQNS